MIGRRVIVFCDFLWPRERIRKLDEFNEARPRIARIAFVLH